VNKQSEKAMKDLPEGTVTFLFTDIEGSTNLLRQLGDEYAKVFAVHRRIMRDAFAKWHGREVDTQGDSFFVSFPRATEAVSAASEIQRTLSNHKWPQGVEVRVRMGLHTGEPLAAEEGYVGMDVHRAARIGAIGHGGQLLLSETTAALVRDEMPEGTSLLDLGRHRLKDIEQPEQIMQLVIQGLLSQFPPPKSLEAIDVEKLRIPNNLPVQSTPFIGRKRELSELEKLLADPDTRQITIVGPGGMGKTRLALALAERLLEIPPELSRNGGARYPDGAFFIPLDGLDETEQIVPEIASSLRFRVTKAESSVGQMEVPERSPKQQLLDYLSNKRLLLVMDNFEHLLDGVGLLSEIRKHAPKVEIIATSREKLGLHGEQLFQLQGMSVPGTNSTATTPHDLATEYSSARLFLQSAKRVAPAITLQPSETQECARICHLVDGIPLALELSAGWVDMLSLGDIASEIEQGLDLLETATQDVPERHRSMEAVFNGTWRRLSLVEQSLFAKLCVFRGGFTRKSAKEVAGASLAELSELMSRSLLLFDRDTNRYDIHRLLRRYGLEQLAIDPALECDGRERHSDYFLKTIAALEDSLYSDKYQSVTYDIEGDLENIRAALHWAAVNQRVRFLGQAIPPLFQYYAWRIHDDILFKDAQMVVKGLAERGTAEAKQIVARAQLRQGWFRPDDDDQELVETGLALLQDLDLAHLDTRRDRAFALWRYGNFILKSHDFVKAREMFVESLALFREVGDRWGEAESIRSMGFVALYAGNNREYAHRMEECATIRQEIGNPLGIALSLDDRAFASGAQGNAEESVAHARQSREIFFKLGDLGSIASSAASMGFYSLFNGHFVEALESYEEAIRIYEKLGALVRMQHSLIFRAFTYLHLGDYQTADSQARQYLDDYQQGAIEIGVGVGHTVISCSAIVNKDYETVLAEGQKASKIFRKIATAPSWLSISLNACLLAHALGGNQVAAKKQLLEILRIQARVKFTFAILQVLPSAALLAARSGDVEEAIELYERAKQHPSIAKSQWHTDAVGKRIDEMAKGLSPEVVEAARQRGRERDPWETAKELLAELEAEGARS